MSVEISKILSGDADLDHVMELINADVGISPTCEGCGRSGSALVLRFDSALSGAEDTALDALLGSYTYANRELKLARYLINKNVDHRQQDYKSSLTTRLYKKLTTVFRGEVRYVEYFADSELTDKVLDVNVVYTRTANGLAVSRTTTRTWYREDGTAHPTTKVTEKIYDAFHQMIEGRRRRQNVINLLALEVLYMLIATTAADPQNPTDQEVADSEVLGNTFLATYNDDVTNYVRTGDLDFVGNPGIGNDNTAWLSTNITAYGWTGPTIRDEIQAALVEIYT